MTEEYNKGYAEGKSDAEQRIAKVLFDAGFTVALERREGDPSIWDDKNKRWIELTEREQK